MTTTRECGVCVRDDRLLIEAALLQAPLRAVGKQFSLNKDMLQRHKARHLAGQTAYLAERRQIERTKVVLDAGREALAKIESTRPTVDVTALETPEDVRSEAQQRYAEVVGVIRRAESLGDHNLALRGQKQALEYLQFFGRVLKMFDEGTMIDRSTKVLTVVGGMSESDLRAFLNGQSGANAVG